MTYEEALRAAQDAVRHRYKAEQLLAATDQGRPDQYDEDQAEALALIGLAFWFGWKQAWSSCHPKMWAHFEVFGRQPCRCGCGISLEETVAGIRQILDGENPPEIDAGRLIGRIVLQFRHFANEPLFAKTLRRVPVANAVRQQSCRPAR
jgi:hypothetical protein